MIFIFSFVHFTLCENFNCSERQGYDSTTGSCIFCPNGKGIIETGECGLCTYFQGINKYTGKCEECAEDECIDPNGYCIKAADINGTIEENSKKCVCPNFEGFDSKGFCQKCSVNDCVDPNTKKCVSNNYGIDNITGKCSKCPNNEGMDPNTRRCIVCPKGSIIENYRCRCRWGLGIDSETNECRQCKEGEHILSNNYCGVCPKGYGVNNDNKCYACNSNQGIDPYTKYCRDYKVNEGKDPKTDFIITCPNGTTRSREFNNTCVCNKVDGEIRGFLSNGECGTCNENEGLDPITGNCIQCKEEQEKNNLYQCKDCADDYYLDNETQKCQHKPTNDKWCYYGNFGIIEVPPDMKKVNSDCACINESLKKDWNKIVCREKESDDYEYNYNFLKKCEWTMCFDQETKECRSPLSDEEINTTNHQCQKCEVGKGIDDNTKKCAICRYDECISPLNNHCIKIKNNVQRDPTTLMCQCPDQLGFTESYDKCITCNQYQGIRPDRRCGTFGSDKCIDPLTKEFRKKKENEGFDPENYYCFTCPENSTVNSQILQCKCNNPEEALDIENGICAECDVGEYIDQKLQICTKCLPPYGIYDGNRCSYCKEKLGVNNITRMCGPCEEGEGILPYSNVCGVCPPNSTFNNETKRCDCFKGFIQTVNETCEKCPPFTSPNRNGLKCVNVESHQCIDPITYNFLRISDLENNTGKNPFNGLCMTCPENASVVNNYCQCNANKGFNSDYTACVDCEPLSGLGKDFKCMKIEFRHCIEDVTRQSSVVGQWPNYYTINRTTLECMAPNCNGVPYEEHTSFCDCPVNSEIFSKTCRCKEGEGIIDESNYTCDKCPHKQGINKTTGYCTDCGPGFCIGAKELCESSENKGINISNEKCVEKCDIGEGINPSTRYCGLCEENQCIDHFSNECRSPLDNETIDPITKKCQCHECPSGTCLDSENKCIALDGWYTIDPITGKCLSECNDGYDPLTRLCGVCAKGSQHNGPQCMCPTRQGIINSTFECDECPEGFGIDRNTNRCTECPNNQGIDLVTGRCVDCRSNWFGIDPVTRICRKCEEGINSKTRECSKCGRNEGISIKNGECIQCLYPFIFDPETNKCSCPTGQGFYYHESCRVCQWGVDPTTGECADCYGTRGIDHESRFCRYCNADECIDPINKECVQVQGNITRRYDSPYCTCQSDHGYDPLNSKCEVCQAGQVIDPDTNRCIFCGRAQGIDPNTLKCRRCPDGQGIDQETRMCTECKEGYGIDSLTRICRQPLEIEGILYNGVVGLCNEGQYIDPITKMCKCENETIGLNTNNKCAQCPKGQTIDTNTGRCIQCPDNLGIDKTTGQFRKCNDDEGKEAETNYCIKCPEGQGIRYNGYCGVCNDGQTIDNITNKCKCGDKYGLHFTFFGSLCTNCIGFIGYKHGISPINNTCVRCNIESGEGIDPETRICTKCDVIDYNKGYCITCPEGTKINLEHHICECDNKQGFDLNMMSCKTCDVGEGINPKTMACERCPKGQGIDEETGKCRECKEGEGMDSKTKICRKCDSIDYITGECTESCNSTQIKDQKTNKCICPDNQGFNNEDEKVCINCPDGKGIDPNTLICKECEDSQCISQSTGMCVGIPEGSGVHPFTKMCQICPDSTDFDQNNHICVCPYGLAYEPESGECIRCNTGYGINQETNRCEKCIPKYGIDLHSGKCVYARGDVCINRFNGLIIDLANGQTWKEDDFLCTCSLGFGFNTTLESCQKCDELEGTDVITNECKMCADDECIDFFNGECTPFVNGQIKNQTNNKCMCPLKLGYNNKNDKNCTDCGLGNGIDFDTKICRRCNNDIKEAADPITGYCRICNENEGIDDDTLECVVCPENSSPDPETNRCTCFEGLGFDPISKTCIVCNTELGFGGDTITGYCRLCNETGEIIDPKTNQCICENHMGFDTYYHNCVNCTIRFGIHYGLDNKTKQCKYCDHYNNVGIDAETKICRNCSDNEGIDPYTYECHICAEGAKSDLNSNYRCKCEPGLGVKQSFKCGECDFGEGINETTNKCNKCAKGYGINPETKICYYCGNNNCIDRVNGLCNPIPDGQTAEEDTRFCTCLNNFGYDPITRNCTDCSAENKGIEWISHNCTTCGEYQEIDEETKKCVCTNKKGFDSEYKQCEDCMIGSGIDPETIQCRNISTSYYVDECINRTTGEWMDRPYGLNTQSITNLCTCSDGYGYNETSGQCEYCNSWEGVDPITDYCVNCTGNLGINWTNSFCSECPENQTIDDEIHRCVCTDKKGFSNYQYNECIKCSDYGSRYGIDYSSRRCRECYNYNNEAIDPVTGLCRTCKENEIISSDTYECVECPENSVPNYNRCDCLDGFGYNPTNKTCEKCNVDLGFGIDIFTGQCRLCNGTDQIIDTETNKCLCTNKKGLDSSDYICIDCNNRYSYGGIDPNTGKCKNCEYYNHEGYDPESGYCLKCKENEGININTKECETCPEGSAPNPSKNYYCWCEEEGLGFNEEKQCTQCKDGEGINSDYGNCGKCSNTYGINPETRLCEYCSGYNNKCIDPLNKECIDIPEGLEADSATSYCICQNNYGFDSSTGNCVDCKAYNMGINITTGYCTECASDQRIDEETNKCICQYKYGFNSDYTECISCWIGIDQNDKKCRTWWSSGECVDRITGYMVNIQDEQYSGKDYYCTCPEGKGFNYTTQTCIQCEHGQGIDSETNECYDCPKGDNIGFFNGDCKNCSEMNAFADPTTGECVCPNKYGFDQYNDYKCVNCTLRHGQGYGIDPNSGTCQYCLSNYECVDPLTGECRDLFENEGIDQYTKECIECVGGQIFDPNTKRCVCSEGYGFDSNNEICIDCTLQSGYAIDVFSGECRLCTGEDEVINRTTKKCICANGKGFNYDHTKCEICDRPRGIDPETTLCGWCRDNLHEGVDPSTGYCTKCNDDEGINPKTGECETCIENATPDPNSYYKCKCPAGLGITKDNQCGECDPGEGIDSNYNTCGKCESQYAINPSTKVCVYCHRYNGDCINQTSGECRETSDSIIGDSNNFCKCRNNLGFDPETGMCTECNGENQGINWFSGVCTTCSSDQFLDAYTNICDCPYNLAFDSEYKHCVSCNNGEGIDSTTRQCRKSDYSYECIDPLTGMWRYTYDFQYKDSTTGICKCHSGLGYNYTTGECYFCDNGEHYDPLTERCVKCESGMGLDWFTGECKRCQGDEVLDEYTQRCICRNNMAYDSNHNCVNCPRGQGIDPDTRFCIECSSDQCIDQESKMCTTISFGQAKEAGTGLCTCDTGYGYNPESNRCVICDLGEGVNPTTKLCESCRSNEGVDMFTGECRRCSNRDEKLDDTTRKCVCDNKKGFNSNHNCVDCPTGEGINPVNYQCGSCQFNQCIDRITGKCKSISIGQTKETGTNLCTCYEGQGYNQTTGRCQVCAPGFGINPTTNLCSACSSGEGIDSFTGQCRSCSRNNEVMDPVSRKCVCDVKKGLDSNNNCIECPLGQGIDPTSRKCITCSNDECIDRVTGECKSPHEGQTPEINTNLCTCESGLGFDETKQQCDACAPGFGINPTTNLCGVCNSGEGIDSFTGQCRSCSRNNEVMDPVSRKCVCDVKKGLDSNNHCIECPLGQGIDPTSRKCITCSNDECIDRVTGECKSPHEGQTPEINTNLCTCESGLGFDETNHKCAVCAPGFGIDEETNICGRCKRGTGIVNNETMLCGVCPPANGIDAESRFCTECNDGEGINQDTKECGKCEDKEGINQTTRLCQKCDNMNGEGINSITRICEKCRNDQGIDLINGECTICPIGSSANPTTHYCECSGGTGLDLETHRCIVCKTGEGIDPVTQICGPCEDGQGIDASSGICRTCKEGEGIDQSSRICGRCSSGQGIDFYSGECVKCPAGQIIDPETSKCICSNKQGFDPNTHECVNCTNQYGVDPITQECTFCSERNSCIDRISGYCIPNPDDQEKNSNTNICQCVIGYGFNPSNNKCEKCKLNEGVDPITNQCTRCIDGEGIIPSTMLCGKCPVGQGIDPKNSTCIRCNENEGIVKDSLKCGQCQLNEGIDRTTRMCGTCKSGFGIDNSDRLCKECSDNMCLICSRNYSYCSFCRDEYIARNGTCINENIFAAVPPQEESKPLSYTTPNENENEIIVEKKEDIPESKNYVVSIPGKEDEKTIIIKDFNNAKVGLEIDHNIKNITIQPSSKTPLDIVVRYQTNDDNVVDQPTITIDNTEISNSDTSLKGEGQLTIQSKNERKELKLNKIVPNKDSQLKIDSKSTVNVNEIELFGNSKVEFANKNQKLLVTTVTLQQKASTELDNIEIKGFLKAGLYSMITLTENVNIDKTNIEISSSNETLNSNPVIVGELRSPPKQISIQKQDLNTILSENDEFIIAESIKNGFQCQKWAEAFVPSSSDSIFNHAECVDIDENMIRLLVNHKNVDDKKGLSGGAIAGIVIAVVAIVAVVVVLIWYFVFHKKKLNSQNEDDSFSDENGTQAI